MVYGTFSKAAGNPLDNEETLLKIMEDSLEEGDNISETIHDKTTFKFEDNQLYFSKEVNPVLEDVELNYPIVESKLDHHISDSWTEALFYGLGNSTPKA